MKYKNFDEFYSTSDDPGFGRAPSVELKDFVEATGLTGSALDLACGDGRDTLFLLDKGFDVTAVDISRVALDKLEKYAQTQKLSGSLTTHCVDITEFKAGRDHFDLITSATGLDHIPLEQTRKLLPSIVSWLKPGGTLYLMVHSTDDPGFASHVPEQSELTNMIRHYFRYNELLNLVLGCNLRVVRYEERVEDDLTHGKPHRHGFATVVALRQESR
ncbi:MAG: class I SAM-dependent methyltransferase [Balneolaceae bacterium]|nr:MAG: class I SAM-dependent methyltransferase [Balneolaceae bacterium]